MKHLNREIDARYGTFRDSWRAELIRVSKVLEADDQRFLGAYKRLASLQAWRAELLEHCISPSSLGFFVEAQNDALVSLTLAALGASRAALQCLRSCIENVLYAAFYMDHPVELKLWGEGKHWQAFNQLYSYFSGHPDIKGISENVHGLQQLSEEYGTLSRAVHGTAIAFRMSDTNAGMMLWSDDRIRIGKWETRQKMTVGALNQLLLCLFRAKLQGAALPNLRKAISLAVARSRHATIRSSLGISLYPP